MMNRHHENIFNYVRISRRIATAGQPLKEEIPLILADGTEVVISLVPEKVASEVPEEQGMVEGGGVIFERIPVEWEAPGGNDFRAFVRAMSRYRDRQCFIHCEANMRVSVFMALYRIVVQGWQVADAMAAVREIWKPNATWQAFIEKILDEHRITPARYGESGLEITLIRNATMKIKLAGLTLLTDPMLSQKGEIESFAGKAPNPTVELPFTVDRILSGIDGILVSHIHQDHFDAAAFAMIPKTVPVYCQPREATRFREAGFDRVVPVADQVTIGEIQLRRIGGRHGHGEWEKQLGTVSGFVLRAPTAPCLYWAGDTVWCEAVKSAIDDHRPEIILVHGCGAELEDSGPIVMDAGQVIDVCRAAAGSTVVAVHMEALDHITVDRRQLRQHAAKHGIDDRRLVIPDDGQTLWFEKEQNP